MACPPLLTLGLNHRPPYLIPLPLPPAEHNRRSDLGSQWGFSNHNGRSATGDSQQQSDLISFPKCDNDVLSKCENGEKSQGMLKSNVNIYRGFHGSRMGPDESRLVAAKH